MEFAPANSGAWFDRVFTRFECCRYSAPRIVSVRFRPDEQSLPIWFRGMYVSEQEHVAFLDTAFHGEGKYNMYVSGFTFAWNRFKKDHELPSYANRREYAKWVAEYMVPVLYEHINTKDIVFEVDRNEGKPLRAAGDFTLRIRDGLKAKGIRYHTIFSGSNGYHTIIEDGAKLFPDYKVSTAPTLGGLAFGAIETTQKLLDELIPDESVMLDEKRRGRVYKDVSVHFSPMVRQGVRKAPYSVTEAGTVVLPVSEREISVDDPKFYAVDNVLAKFRIKGRGYNNL